MRNLTRNIDWMMQMGTVAYRVYSLIFLRPLSPSFCSFSRGGETLAGSWEMFDGERYGMMPGAEMGLVLRLTPPRTETEPSTSPRAGCAGPRLGGSLLCRGVD